MISTKTIVDKANQIIAAGSLTDLQITQLAGAEGILNNSQKPPTVATFSALPSAANNKGVIYFVTAEGIHYFSDGTYWRKDFRSTLGPDTSILSAFGWGLNQYGRIGDNTVTNRSSPVISSGGLLWTRIIASFSHSLGIASSGIAYAWGNNSFGKLGDNTTSNRSSPVTVVGGITNWTQVAAATSHSIGITATGIAYAWGYNVLGQLGDNTTSSRSSPVIVTGGISNWRAVSAGGSTGSNLGVTSSGILYAWGQNSNGQLGDNTTSNRSSPVTVVGGITTWDRISCGRTNSLGLTAAGVAYGWGNNSSGQVGDNTTSNRSSPVTVVGGITNWSDLAGSGNGYHCLGVTASSIAYAWGQNSIGQVGDNTTSNRSSPVTVVGGITNWRQLSAGQFHSHGLTTTGIAYAWGYNGAGRLGDNTVTNRSSPVTVVGGITTWSQISAGQSHSLALAATVTKGF